LRVSRPDRARADDTNPSADEVYQRAGDNVEQLKNAAPLIVEETPSLYIYRLQMGDHAQTGIAACCSIDDYDADVIRKHERTRKDKEDDRTRHMVTIHAQTGPVFLTYRGTDEINQAVSATQATEPLFDFTAADGVKHTIWRMSDELTEKVSQAFADVPLLYIADGHHRAASASRARAALQAENPNHTGTEEYNFFLTVLFPADQLRILPYNRTVKDLNGLSEGQFLDALQREFVVIEPGYNTPESKGEICMFIGSRWLTLKPERGGADDPIRSLDVSVLQELILEPLLGITDIRTDKRIEFVGGIRGTTALEKAVNEGNAAVAFSLYPVSIDELIKVSDDNEIMPPKSTWFEPKLRDGLLSHLI
jgi:uncharacterized protein (DUF1015 family)